MYGNRGHGSGGFAPVKVGEEIDVKIEAVGEKGDGIAKKKGFVLFVPNTKEGDEVRIRITKVLSKVGFAESIGAAQGPIETDEKPAEEAQAPAAEPVVEEPAAEDTEDFGEEPATEETPAEEAPAEEAQEEEQPAEEPATEETPAEEAPTRRREERRVRIYKFFFILFF
jgi:predicted RNA-binding protein with TRAM domain